MEEDYKSLVSTKHLRLELLRNETVKIVDFKGQKALYIKTAGTHNRIIIRSPEFCSNGFSICCSVTSENELENLCPLIIDTFTYSCSS